MNGRTTDGRVLIGETYIIPVLIILLLDQITLELTEVVHTHIVDLKRLIFNQREDNVVLVVIIGIEMGSTLEARLAR